MDKVEQYKKIVRALVEHFAEQEESSAEDMKTALITDDQHGHYLLMMLGWQNNHRTYYPYLHIDVQQGKIFIEKNMSEMSIAKELEDRGVPKDDIVLAFQAPYKRIYSGYAVS